MRLYLTDRTYAFSYGTAPTRPTACCHPPPSKYVSSSNTHRALDYVVFLIISHLTINYRELDWAGVYRVPAASLKALGTAPEGEGAPDVELVTKGEAG